MVKDQRKPTLMLNIKPTAAKKRNNIINMDYTTSSSSATSSDGDDNSSFSHPSTDENSDSPIMMSPWNQASPLPISPPAAPVGSLRRQDGHVYSLAAKNGLLYTGSESKNIRVWKNMREFNAFKSSSGFVKAIVISADRIFTGHQDGRIRVWKIDNRCTAAVHKQIGTMPTFFDVLKASMRPKNYVEVKPNRTALWIKHADAISCMSMDEENGLLYSASWDRTFKVWQLHNSKCIESVKAHDDAINAIVAGGAGQIYTGSADGTVRVWKREQDGKAVKHFLRGTLIQLGCAVTALAVGESGEAVYCGSSDGLVNYWEVDGKDLSHGGVLKGHKLAVLCLATAGNLVLSGSADNTICVWRREGPATHACITVLSGHTGPVKCLAVEEDKEGGGGGDRKWKVYSGSLDKSVKVWSVSEMASDIPQMQVRYGCWDWNGIPNRKY